MCLLAALAPLALVASDAGLTAAVGAPALGVTVAASVEVRAAHLLSEDVDHVLLLPLVWALTSEHRVFCWLGSLGVLGLSWVLLEEASVDLALEELISRCNTVLWRSPGLQFGSIVSSLALVLWLGRDEELPWRDSLANAAHLASLVEDLEVLALALGSLCHLPEDLLSVDWRLPM